MNIETTTDKARALAADLSLTRDIMFKGEANDYVPSWLFDEISDAAAALRDLADAAQERDTLTTALAAAEADAAAARARVRRLLRILDHATESAAAIVAAPQGSLWNCGTSPTALEKAHFEGARAAAQEILMALHGYGQPAAALARQEDRT